MTQHSLRKITSFSDKGGKCNKPRVVPRRKTPDNPCDHCGVNLYYLITVSATFFLQKQYFKVTVEKTTS